MFVNLKSEITYPDNKGLSDLLGKLHFGKLGELNLVLLGSQPGTSRRQGRQQILAFLSLDHCSGLQTFWVRNHEMKWLFL